MALALQISTSIDPNLIQDKEKKLTSIDESVDE